MQWLPHRCGLRPIFNPFIQRTLISRLAHCGHRATCRVLRKAWDCLPARRHQRDRPPIRGMGTVIAWAPKRCAPGNGAQHTAGHCYHFLPRFSKICTSKTGTRNWLLSWSLLVETSEIKPVSENVPNQMNGCVKLTMHNNEERMISPSFHS